MGNGRSWQSSGFKLQDVDGGSKASLSQFYSSALQILCRLTSVMKFVEFQVPIEVITKNFYLLGYNAEQPAESQSLFQRNPSSPS